MIKIDEKNTRAAKAEYYTQVELIMRQVHTLHVNLRPDIYKNGCPVYSKTFFEHLINVKSINMELI